MTVLNILITALLIHHATATSFDIVNADANELWIGIQANDGLETLNNGGFVLGAGQTTTITPPEGWSGRFWARTGCDPETQHCLTGDCGDKLECAGAGGAPPVTLAEVKLNGDQNQEFYDISLVNGFNIKATIEPTNGCKKVECTADVNGQCPDELKDDQNGEVVACWSACDKLGGEEYCCTGSHNDPSTCPPTDYSKFFKNLCPDAYSYAFDDPTSLWTCQNADYTITFGG